jgi:small subunit ribosomal protein S20
MRQAVRHQARNKAVRSSVRTYVKKAGVAVAASAEDAAAVVRQAVSELDKAAQKGIVHRNAAARRKSRLMSRLHQLSVAAPATETKSTATKSTTRKAASAAKPGARKPAARKPAAKK